MAELIDRAALLKHEVESDRLKGVFLVVPKGFILDAPTVDAEPVVRCHECKHCAMHHRYPLCKLREEYTEPDAFCSSGQRRKRMDADAPERGERSGT